MSGKATFQPDRRYQSRRGQNIEPCRPPATTSPGPWDAFADADMVFVDEEAGANSRLRYDGARPMRRDPGPCRWPEQALRKAVMAIWCGLFAGMKAAGT